MAKEGAVERVHEEDGEKAAVENQAEVADLSESAAGKGKLEIVKDLVKQVVELSRKATEQKNLPTGTSGREMTDKAMAEGSPEKKNEISAEGAPEQSAPDKVKMTHTQERSEPKTERQKEIKNAGPSSDSARKLKGPGRKVIGEPIASSSGKNPPEVECAGGPSGCSNGASTSRQAEEDPGLAGPGRKSAVGEDFVRGRISRQKEGKKFMEPVAGCSGGSGVSGGAPWPCKTEQIMTGAMSREKKGKKFMEPVAGCSGGSGVSHGAPWPCKTEQIMRGAMPREKKGKKFMEPVAGCSGGSGVSHGAPWPCKTEQIMRGAMPREKKGKKFMEPVAGCSGESGVSGGAPWPCKTEQIMRGAMSREKKGKKFMESVEPVAGCSGESGVSSGAPWPCKTEQIIGNKVRLVGVQGNFYEIQRKAAMRSMAVRQSRLERSEGIKRSDCPNPEEPTPGPSRDPTPTCKRQENSDVVQADVTDQESAKFVPQLDKGEVACLDDPSKVPVLAKEVAVKETDATIPPKSKRDRSDDGSNIPVVAPVVPACSSETTDAVEHQASGEMVEKRADTQNYGLRLGKIGLTEPGESRTAVEPAAEGVTSDDGFEPVVNPSTEKVPHISPEVNKEGSAKDADQKATPQVAEHGVIEASSCDSGGDLARDLEIATVAADSCESKRSLVHCAELTPEAIPSSQRNGSDMTHDTVARKPDPAGSISARQVWDVDKGKAMAANLNSKSPLDDAASSSATSSGLVLTCLPERTANGSPTSSTVTKTEAGPDKVENVSKVNRIPSLPAYTR